MDKGSRQMGKWYETAVFYHIYPLGLCGAPRENHQTEAEHRLRNLEEWLDHIQDLGCLGLYIGPLFESSSHGYDTVDYRQIDRRLGDNADFAHFVQEAHRRDIRVVVDGVFNHTGREFFAFRDVRENRERSRYCGWYRGLNFGWNNGWNDGFSYESWDNGGHLVKLNLQNREVKDYLFDVVRFWIREFDIDGIRLDCADCLDFDFMKELRWMTGNEKADFWLMGEVIHGDYSRWANQEMLHSVTNYELHKGLYSGHNDHNYFEIAHTIRRQFDENGGIYRGRVLYSFVDNHDVSRLVNKLNDRRHLRPVYTLLYTLPGLPSIYYGSEWGIEGRKEDGDAALRPAIDLPKIRKDPPVSGLEEFLKFLGDCRRSCPVISTGRYRELLLTNRQYAFARMDETCAVITAVNNDEKEADCTIRLPIQAAGIRDLESGESLQEANGQLFLKVPGNGYRLLAVNC